MSDDFSMILGRHSGDFEEKLKCGICLNEMKNASYPVICQNSV